ncbi:MAG: hypothetical protein ABEI52_12590, partial [Halobacteriaceae archaeon]
ELGRTDKSYPFTNGIHGTPPEDVPPNPKARYALHFHKTGIGADTPHEVQGISVHGSPGWGVVNHKSLAHVTDSVTYQVFGTGFVAENGIERGSFKRNFALRSEGSGEFVDARAFNTDEKDHNVDDFGHGGHGFWVQGPLVGLENNVAGGHRYYAFVFWNRALVERELKAGEKVRTIGSSPNLPIPYVDGQDPLKSSKWASEDKVRAAFVRIEDCVGNTAFASAGGLDISRQMNLWPHQRQSEWGLVSDFTAYNLGAFVDHSGTVHDPKDRITQGGNAAITVRYVSNLVIKNSRLISGSGRDGMGISRNLGAQNISLENLSISGFKLGLRVPNKRYFRCTTCTFENDVDILADERDHRAPRKTKIEDLSFADSSQDNIQFSPELSG